MARRIRVPKRVAQEMRDTGWAMSSWDGSAQPTDAPRRRLIELLDATPYDKGFAIDDPDERMLARLYFEAEHYEGGWLFGDHDSETYALYRAARKLKEAIVALVPTMSYNESARLL